MKLISKIRQKIAKISLRGFLLGTIKGFAVIISALLALQIIHYNVLLNNITKDSPHLDIQLLELDIAKVDKEFKGNSFKILGHADSSIFIPWETLINKDNSVMFKNGFHISSDECIDHSKIKSVIQENGSNFDFYKKILTFKPEFSFKKILFDRTLYDKKLKSFTFLKESLFGVFNISYNFNTLNLRGFQLGSPDTGIRLKLFIFNDKDECSELSITDTSALNNKMSIGQEEINNIITSIKVK